MTSRLLTGFAILACGFVTAQAQAQSRAPRSFGFDKTREGEYTIDALNIDWPNPQAQSLYGRAFIGRDDVKAHGKVLRVSYPKGSVGPQTGGIQFLVPLAPANEYWLSYQVKFEEGFDFRIGGKLPGLTSGGSRFTGGNPPSKGEGWSARYMWKDSGKIQVYLYYIDMPGQYGQGLGLKEAAFVPGRWHRITQHIRLNKGDAADGLLEVWFDEVKALSRSDIRFRLGEQGLIDSFYFSTFHGGNTDDWAPEHDSFARFDDFVLDTRRPSFIKP